MDASKFWDVIVCGAGVGGAVTAECLAAQGFDTLLLEKQGVPRYKACGGAVTQEFVDEFALPDEIIQRRVNCLVLHHVDHQRLEKQGEGACVWRAELDAFLIQRAVAVGAVLHDQTAVLSVQKEPNHFRVMTEQETFQGRVLIAADGVTSTVLRSVGWKHFRTDELAYTRTHEIKLNEEAIEQHFGDHHLHLYFGHPISRMGYGWVFPKRDTVTVGWGCQLSHIRNVQTEFHDFLQVLAAQLAQGSVVRRAAHLIPAALRPPFGNDGLIGVGDAVGLVDPLSGKGIPYAAKSGQLAANAVAQSLENEEPTQATEKYQSALESEMLRGLQAKKAIQIDIYRNEENIHRFLQLWCKHRSTTIATSLW